MNVDHIFRGATSLEDALHVARTKFVFLALEQARGNKSVASERLKIHRNTLDRILAISGMPDDAVESKIRAIKKQARSSGLKLYRGGRRAA